MSNPREREFDLGDTHAGDDCWRDILDVRTINAINNASILYTNGVKPKMRQIFALSDNELSRLKTMGPVGIRKIREAQRRLQGAPVAEWDVDSLASLLIAFAEDHPLRKAGDAMQEAAKRLRSQGGVRHEGDAVFERDLQDFAARDDDGYSITTIASRFAHEIQRLRASRPSQREEDGRGRWRSVKWRDETLAWDDPRMVYIETRTQRDGTDLFAVSRFGQVMAKDGSWEFEPTPSSRDDAFIGRTRFTSFEEARSAFEGAYGPDSASPSTPAGTEND